LLALEIHVVEMDEQYIDNSWVECLRSSFYDVRFMIGRISVSIIVEEDDRFSENEGEWFL
jgi:hypothetical protein